MLVAEEAPRAVQVVEPPAQATVAGPDTVVSSSLQFRISGGEGKDRGMAALFAEEAKGELLVLIGEKDEWRISVGIRLHGRPGDPLPARTVSIRRMVVAGVNEMVVNVHLSRGIEREKERFKRAVTAALLYERTLKEAPSIDVPLSVPPWLSDGLREATAWQLNQSDRKLYKALFESGLFKINQIFSVTERGFENMDGATRAAFRISSGALVMALLEQPDGKEGFRKFVTEVASFEGEMPSLMRKHFPELNLSETSLSKWWALQMANKGGLSLLTDILTVQLTEEALTEALWLEFKTDEGIVEKKEFRAWPELAAMEQAQRIATVRNAGEALVRLSMRCFPSYRPLLVEYQAVLEALARNETTEIPAKLAELDEIRLTMIVRANRARDYLDWFEITRARETSGEFDDYLRLTERLKDPPHRRKDDLSKYLDRMDEIFFREQQESIFGMPSY